jgi:hypothetical protein
VAQVRLIIAHAHGVQIEVVHRPLQHRWPAAQTTPQPPQFIELLSRFVSYPLVPVVALRSQSPILGSHAAPYWHRPPTHVAVNPTGGVGQAYPQPPQFVTLVLVFVSQPFRTLLSQLPKPVAQDSPQPRSEHTGVLLGPDAQAMPHRLQLLVVLIAVSQPLPEFPSQLPKPR